MALYNEVSHSSIPDASSIPPLWLSCEGGAALSLAPHHRTIVDIQMCPWPTQDGANAVLISESLVSSSLTIDYCHHTLSMERLGIHIPWY